MEGWKSFIKYPDLIPRMPPEVRELLDTLETLVPVKFDRDRLGTYLTWRGTCVELGLINSREVMALNDEMINGCGGL